MTAVKSDSAKVTHSLHNVGVLSGLAAGAWLGGAEAPNKLTTAVGLSPFLISLCMVFGVQPVGLYRHC